MLWPRLTSIWQTSSNSPEEPVGLGAAMRVDGVTVRWPDGMRETFGNFAANQTVKLRREAGSAAAARRRDDAERRRYCSAPPTFPS